MTYQEVTGALSHGAHPGSYNGQDAYNDMLVIDDGSNVYRERASQPAKTERAAGCAELYARPESGSDNEPPRGEIAWTKIR